ncbi:MAG: YiiD C-terminal domain-containing protein [Pseudomonadota bacterium]
MTAAELQAFFEAEIPISVPMGLQVVVLKPGSIQLMAPLAANRNDKHTAFGGSIASMLLMAGWGLLHVELRRRELEASVVIQKSEFLYHRPVDGVITAYCDLPSEDQWTRFISGLERRGRARIAMTSWVAGPDCAAVTMDGRYVADRRGEQVEGLQL